MTIVQPDVRVTGRRIVATIIDGVILGLVDGAVYRANFSDQSGHVDFAGGPGPWYVLIAGLYYFLMEGTLGRTVGKILTGIRVVDAATGRRPGLMAVFMRTLLRLIDGLGGYLVAFIVVMCSQRRRRIGDIVANTLVVRP